MENIITAMAYYHLDIKGQFNYKERFNLQSTNYLDVVRLYAMLGIIPGEKEIQRTLDFNYKILKEIK